MTAASMELAPAAKMTASTGMRATEARPATVESTASPDMTTAEMRAAAPATAHMNAAAMPSTTMTAAARARVGCDGQSCQEGRRYDRDFEKMSHGFTPRI